MYQTLANTITNGEQNGHRPTDNFEFITQVVEVDFSENCHSNARTVHDTKDKLVVGFAIWERLGPSEYARRWRRRMIPKLPQAEESAFWQQYEELFKIPDPEQEAANDRYNRFRLMESKIKKEIFSNGYQECWYLRDIFVEPNWTQHGAADMPINWAKDHAQKEQACLGTFQPNYMRPFLGLHGFEFMVPFSVKENTGEGALGGIRRIMWRTKVFGLNKEMEKGALEHSFDTRGVERLIRVATETLREIGGEIPSDEETIENVSVDEVST